jgi:glutamine amidotransferase
MILILDLGWGNLGALEAFFYRLCPNVLISQPHEAIKTCSQEKCVIVWPGVGSAVQFSRLDASTKDMLTLIFSSAEKNIAICLGFQILFGFSEESQLTGLSLMCGEVKKLKSPCVTYRHVPLITSDRDIASDGRFYFNHSYFIASPDHEGEYVDRFLNVDNQRMLVMRRSENFLGCQFHPEKSGSDGVELLREFIS